MDPSAPRVVWDRLDIDRELSIPSVFSTFILALLAVELWRRSRFDIGFSRHWKMLSAVVAFAAIDEFAALHERLIGPMESVGGGRGFFMFGWVIPGIAVIAIVGLASLQLLSGIEKHLARLLVFFGSVYVLGAVGFEMLYGEFVGPDGSQYVGEVFVIIEESLEMAGVIGLLAVLWSHPHPTEGSRTGDIPGFHRPTEPVEGGFERTQQFGSLR